MDRTERKVVARRAAQQEQLARYARAISQWLSDLEGPDDGCSICGIGPHVERCPVPELRAAEEKLRFMAAVPVATIARTRGTSHVGPASEDKLAAS